MDFNTDINTDFEEKSPLSRRCYIRDVSRSSRSYFLELLELDILISTGKLVQKFLPKQANIDKILKIIQ